MLRIHGRMSLAAALVCAGLVRAAPAPPAGKPADDDKIMTITDGTKAHRCEVLKKTKHGSGYAYEVKDLETGEIMTVLEGAATTQAALSKPAAPPVTKSEPAIKPASKSDDPILQPKQYSTSQRVQQQLVGESTSYQAEAKYNKAPLPASKRWFAQSAPSKPAVAVAAVAPVEAVRHPDPVFRLIGCLRDDLLPSMREIAAETLAHSDGRNRPEVITALEEAAAKDPAESVRFCCSRCLNEIRGR